jgi:HK97 family phage portal protein
LDEVDQSSNLAKLLMKPNPNQGADAFFEGVFSFYFLKGESFIWLNRGGKEGGEVLEMYIVPPSKITLVADEQDLYGIKYYLLDIGGKPIPIQKEDILHWKTFNPEFDAQTRSHLRGFDPMKPLKRRLQQDNDSMDAAVAMFQNGGAKGVIFEKSLIDLTPTQETQLQKVVDTKLNNNKMKAAIAQLQGDWGYLDLGLNSVDMQLLGAQELTLKRLCAAFGFPYEFFQSDTTFANKEMAQKGWVSNIIMAACNSFRDEFNRTVTASFKSGFCDFEFDMLPEMQEDVKEMATTYALLHDRGIINTDEFRELSGFEPSGNPIHKLFMYNGVPIEDIITPAQDNTTSKWNDYTGEN